jgi:MFS superfamily sulfate permease-like transporter
VLALWSATCLMGAFDVPFCYLPALAMPWVAQFQTRSEAAGELNRRLGHRDFLVLGIAFGIVLLFVGLTHAVFNPERLAYAETFRKPAFAILWVAGFGVLVRSLIARRRHASVSDT